MLLVARGLKVAQGLSPMQFGLSQKRIQSGARPRPHAILLVSRGLKVAQA